MRPLIPFLERKLRVLDLGGTPSFWLNLQSPFHARWDITLLNLNPSDPAPGFEMKTGDVSLLAAEDLAGFDLLFSNSVIEHLGTWSAKRRMATAIFASRLPYFVQTPNFWFPMEPHWLIPGFQFLPRPIQRTLLTRGFSPREKSVSIDRAEEMIEEIQLLTRYNLATLFPGATLLRERIVGLTKSFVAYDLRGLAPSPQ